jgi:hypothetical protein
LSKGILIRYSHDENTAGGVLLLAEDRTGSNLALSGHLGVGLLQRLDRDAILLSEPDASEHPAAATIGVSHAHSERGLGVPSFLSVYWRIFDSAKSAFGESVANGCVVVGHVSRLSLSLADPVFRLGGAFGPTDLWSVPTPVLAITLTLHWLFSAACDFR